MNEYILRAITNRTSLTPNMSADVDKAIAAQELAIKEARTREAVNRRARLEAEVETQELVAGIKVPEGSTYSPSDITNSLKGIIANQTVAAAAIKRGDATEEQVRQYTEGKRYLGSLGETYGAMSYLVDEYTKTNRAKGSDGTIEGSIDPSSLIPQFAAGLDILNPNSAAKGNVSIESVYENGSYKTYQIFQSEKIREINKQMYEGEQNPEVRKKYLNENGEISDVYRMSYEDIKNIENDADGNIYEYGGLFSTVPGTSVVRDAAQKSNIFSKNNSSVTDEYMEAIPQQKTIDLNGRRVVVDRFIPNINAIASAIKPESDALTRTIFSGGRNAPYASFVKANSQKFGKENFQIEEDGSIKVKLLKRDENGKYIINEDGSYERDSEFTKIGSENLTDGRFNVASGTGSRYLGMSQEDFDKANRFTQDVSMIDLNLTQAGKEEINEAATRELNKPPRVIGVSEQESNLKKERTNRIIKRIGDFGNETLTDETKITDFNRYLKDQIQGIEGYDVFTGDGKKTYASEFGDFEIIEVNKRRRKEGKPAIKKTDTMPAGTIFFSSSTGKGETVDTEEFNIKSPKDRASLSLYLETIRGSLYSEEGQSVLELLKAK